VGGRGLVVEGVVVGEVLMEELKEGGGDL